MIGKERPQGYGLSKAVEMRGSRGHSKGANSVVFLLPRVQKEPSVFTQRLVLSHRLSTGSRVHSIHTYSLSAYYVPDIGLGTRDTAMKEITSVSSLGPKAWPDV